MLWWKSPLGHCSVAKGTVVLLFHTQEPAQQFYRDGSNNEEGVYWYGGEGTLADMQWTTAIALYAITPSSGLIFYSSSAHSGKDGLWRFLHIF